MGGARGGARGVALGSVPRVPDHAEPPVIYDHVIWIVMENHSYDQIIGSSDAPYLNKLAGEFGLATNLYADRRGRGHAMLRATQEMLNLTPLLGDAATADDLRAAFNV